MARQRIEDLPVQEGSAAQDEVAGGAAAPAVPKGTWILDATPDRITDGTSNTIMFGEKSPNR